MKACYLISLCLAFSGLAAWGEDAASLLAAAEQASGGKKWDDIRTIHWRETSLNGGLKGTLEEWDDARTGRYLSRVDRPPATYASGFDGLSIWTETPGHRAYILADDDPRQGAVNTAYQIAHAFWFPDRDHATLTLGAPQTEQGRIYAVITITPQAGRPFDVWIDRGTHLIDRYVEQQAEDIQITRLLNYRPAPGGILLPHVIRTGDGDPKWDEVDTVDSVEVNAAIDDRRFSVPAAPAPDFHFENGQSSTTLPFHLDDGKLIVALKINGQGPFEAEFDSGGDYIFPPRVAKKLGLVVTGALQSGGGGEGFSASGKTVAGGLDLGGLHIDHPCGDVMDFSDDHPERTLIGLQILQRVVVSLDFDRGLMTLTDPAQFHYRGAGAVIPFGFQSNQPEVRGAVDGVAGTFCIDTGDDSGLLLIAPFARRYGLVDHYHAVIPYGGSSLGRTHGVLTRAHTIAFDGADGRALVEAHDPVTRISMQQGGFDADRYVSGNIGIDILDQFNFTFDYAHQCIIFEKNRTYGTRANYDGTGLQLKTAGAGWEVTYLVAHGPGAEAGLQVGDRIESINGQNAIQLGSEARYALVRQPAGTRLELKVVAPGGSRVVPLTLRNVL